MAVLCSVHRNWNRQYIEISYLSALVLGLLLLVAGHSQPGGNNSQLRDRTLLVREATITGFSGGARDLSVGGSRIRAPSLA